MTTDTLRFPNRVSTARLATHLPTIVWILLVAGALLVPAAWAPCRPHPTA